MNGPFFIAMLNYQSSRTWIAYVFVPVKSCECSNLLHPYHHVSQCFYDFSIYLFYMFAIFSPHFPHVLSMSLDVQWVNPAPFLVAAHVKTPRPRHGGGRLRDIGRLAIRAANVGSFWGFLWDFYGNFNVIWISRGLWCMGDFRANG